MEVDATGWSVASFGWPVLIVGVLALSFLIWLTLRHLSLRPSNDRSWVNDNERVATAEFDGDVVTIRNVRDFHWRTMTTNGQVKLDAAPAPVRRSTCVVSTV